MTRDPRHSLRTRLLPFLGIVRDVRAGRHKRAGRRVKAPTEDIREDARRLTTRCRPHPLQGWSPQ